ncbi:MAG: glutathione peroxidase [Oligoflexus sp.]
MRKRFQLMAWLFFATYLFAFQVSANNKNSNSIYQFDLPGLKGQKISLANYQGKVILIANTASHCGYTKQYKGLQGLHETYQDKGMVVIGVPSNSFKQEFKEEKEVAKFCEMNYGVKFQMAKILPVKGNDAHPLFQFLTAQSSSVQKASRQDVSWNFEKFLIDRKGQVRYRFNSKVDPNSPEMKKAVQKLLSES